VTPAPRDVEVYLSDEELATVAGLSRARIAGLVRLGLIEPETPDAGRFTASAAIRLRRMLRLRADLGVNLTGAAIIVDLVRRLDRLEQECARLRRRAPSVRLEEEQGRWIP